MANEKLILAGAYVRVSTDEQAESGYSLQMQRERISAQITAKGWKLSHIYKDSGQSGGKLDRPVFNEMLNDSVRLVCGYGAVSAKLVIPHINTHAPTAIGQTFCKL